MSKYVSLAAAAAVATMISFGATAAQAATYSFFVVPLEENDNSPNSAFDVSGQLFFDVTDPGGGNVSFKFRNEGSLASSITEIYFDDSNGNLIQPPIVVNSVSDADDVKFEAGTAQPPDLPGGNEVDPPFSVTTGILAQSQQKGGQGANGINPDEWLELWISLKAGVTLSEILAAIESGALRVGLHVTALPDGESDAYVNLPNPIPLPAGLVLFLSGLAGIGVLGRYKAKRRELATV